jgi:hypothetical protein
MTATFRANSRPRCAKVVDATYATATRVAAGAPLVNRWHKTFIRRVHPSGAAVGRPFSAAEQARGGGPPPTSTDAGPRRQGLSRLCSLYRTGCSMAWTLVLWG